MNIDTDLTRSQTFSVLNPFGRIDQHIMDDADLAGPVFYFLLFGFFLLFVSLSTNGTWMFLTIYSLGRSTLATSTDWPR
jgi:hypothetical protein